MSKYLVWLFDFKYVKKISTVVLGVCTIWLLVYVTPYVSLPNKTVQDYVVQDVLGEDVVNEIKDKRFYNSMGLGGYFICLDIKPFTDTRNDVYLEQFGNPDIYNAAMRAMYDEGLMYNLTSKYNLSYLVLEKNNITSQIFYASSLWEVSVESDNYVIFKKKG